MSLSFYYFHVKMSNLLQIAWSIDGFVGQGEFASRY